MQVAFQPQPASIHESLEESEHNQLRKTLNDNPAINSGNAPQGTTPSGAIKKSSTSLLTKQISGAQGSPPNISKQQQRLLLQQQQLLQESLNRSHLQAQERGLARLEKGQFYDRRGSSSTSNTPTASNAGKSNSEGESGSYNQHISSQKEQTSNLIMDKITTNKPPKVQTITGTSEVKKNFRRGSNDNQLVHPSTTQYQQEALRNDTDGRLNMVKQ